MKKQSVAAVIDESPPLKPAQLDIEGRKLTMNMTVRTRFKNIMVFGFLSLVFSLIAHNAAAAADFKLSAEEAEGSSGNQAVVSVEVENAAGTEGGQFILNYDSTLVRPVVVEAGKLIAKARSSLYMVNLEYAPGQLMFMWVTVFADTDNAGVVCTITFELLKEGISGLTFGEALVAPDGIRIGEMIAGKISIGAMEVDQEDSEPNSLEQEDEAEIDDDNQVLGMENGEEGETETATENGGNGSFLLYWSAAVVVLVAAGVVVLNRLKKFDSKKIKR